MMGGATIPSLRPALIPAVIGIALAVGLYLRLGWWGFLVLFPWIGAAISIGIHLRQILPRERRALGRKVSILLILPALLVFVPLANHENLQLEGIVLLLSIGFFGKGVVHYAVAKVFGPLIWGRGFCGWACWTAAVLDWLPVDGASRRIPDRIRSLRLLALLLSVGFPLLLILGMGFNVRGDYFRQAEVGWMATGNAIYYALAIPLAYLFRDRRAFCKILCPVAPILKVPTRYSLLRVRPTGTECLGCGLCAEQCPMGIDVMGSIQGAGSVSNTECILCATCIDSCPAGALAIQLGIG